MLNYNEMGVASLAEEEDGGEGVDGEFAWVANFYRCCFFCLAGKEDGGEGIV